MAYHAIFIASFFLLVAFALERLGRATGLPAVIMMVGVGLLARPLADALDFSVRGLNVVVPILGAVGLVLIVLEGALDIQLGMDRIRTASSAILTAIAGFVLCGGIFAAVAAPVLELSYYQAAIIAIPFAVISSAVAIPSSQFMPASGREFVVYESSVSDIIGVLVFFAFINGNGSFAGMATKLVGGGALSLLLSVVCSIGLVLILMRIDGHIRFIPLLAGLFGLYSAGKLLHLSPLIMVLFFGLALNNSRLLTRFKPFKGWLDGDYETTLNGFKGLVRELTFAVRGFFFILLGYWTDLSDLATMEAWLASALVLAVVYAGRFLLLKLFKHELSAPLTWIAPRGLITVLLFLGAKEALPLPDFLGGTVVLVVLVSAALVAVAQRVYKKMDRREDTLGAAKSAPATPPPAAPSSRSA